MGRMNKYKGITKKGKSRIKEHGEWWIDTGESRGQKRQIKSYETGYIRWIKPSEDADFMYLEGIAWNDIECETYKDTGPISEFKFVNRTVTLDHSELKRFRAFEDGLAKGFKAPRKDMNN